MKNKPFIRMRNSKGEEKDFYYDESGCISEKELIAFSQGGDVFLAPNSLQNFC